MRKINSVQIAVFSSMLTAAAALAVCSSWILFGRLPLGDFRGISLCAATVIFLYIYAILFYRAFLKFNPLRAGEIVIDSRQEFVYHVYILFFLLIFYPVMRSGILPAPLMRVFYLALGTKLGSNTYCQGIIHDPPFIEVGSDCTIGQYALLVPHVIEGNRLGHYPIRIGNNVTVGAHAVVLADVEIGDDAVVATGAIVTKGTIILRGEVWGGVPAKCLRRLHEP